MFVDKISKIATISSIIAAIVSVLGKREPLHRFIIEEGVKPAIFGSYSYDPLRQVFEPPPPDKNDTVPSQFYNQTHVLSTVLGKEPHHTDKNASVFFRKHVTHKTTPWWARHKLYLNSTTKHHLV